MYIAACVVRKDTGPSREALGYFMERAERIAESLQLAMFGFPGLPVKRAQFFRRLRMAAFGELLPKRGTRTSGGSESFSGRLTGCAFAPN